MPTKARRGRKRPGILDVVEQTLQQLGNDFERDRDPFRAWEAFHLAAQYQPWGIATPAWALAYLERAAARMVELARTPDAGAGLAEKVAAALELTAPGRGTPLTRRSNAARDYDLASRVALLVDRDVKAYIAIEEISKLTGESRTTVERAYLEAKTRGELGLTSMTFKASEVPSGLPAGTRIDLAADRSYSVERTLDEDKEVIVVLVRRIEKTEAVRT